MKSTQDIADSCIRRAHSILKRGGSCIDLTAQQIDALLVTDSKRWERCLSGQSFLGLTVNKVGETRP